MKNTIIFIALLFCFQAYAQRKPKIKGNRSVIEVREDLPPFNAISLNDDLEIILQKGPQEGYVINADDNLIDILKFKVKDSILHISAFYKVTAKKKLEITVNYDILDAITMRDGKINMKDVISSDVLEVQTYGSSRLELNASVSVMNISMEGISSGDYNIASDSLNVTVKDRTDARVYAVGESSVINAYKNASVKMEGTTDSLTVNMYENANLKAEKYEAGSAKVNMQGSPNARIYALKEFELTSSGSSKTSLYGNPKIEILEFLDVSQLHKEKE